MSYAAFSAAFNLQLAEMHAHYPGMVIREAEGERILQSMVWGFSYRLREMKPESKPKAINNIADISKPMCSGLAVAGGYRRAYAC